MNRFGRLFYLVRESNNETIERHIRAAAGEGFPVAVEEVEIEHFPAEREIECSYSACHYSWANRTLFGLIREHGGHLRTCTGYSPCHNAAERYTPRCAPCPRQPDFPQASRHPRQLRRLLRLQSLPQPQHQALSPQRHLPRRSPPRPGSAWSRRPAQSRIAGTDNHQREIARSFCRSQAGPLCLGLKACLRMKPAAIRRVKQAGLVFLTWYLSWSLRGDWAANWGTNCCRPSGQLCREG